MRRRLTIDRSKRLELSVVGLALAGLGGLALLSIRGLPLPFYYGYVLASACVGLALYLSLGSFDQPLRRRLVHVLLGASLFGAAALRDPLAALFQIEGLFFDLFSGVLFAAVIHYLIAKLVGPLIFGRVWCGWACWTAALLDQLPYKRSPGRLAARWGLLRYAHFALSLALVALLWYGLAYRPGAGGLSALAWFLAGNLLYDLLGVGMAVALRDNRAFCKYACPVAVVLKLGAPSALLKVKGQAERCCARQVCEKACPMDIRITDYIKRGERVTASECILCQACIEVCPEQALALSFGLDRGGPDLLRERAVGEG
jgi:ferredoxin-type protein NapH